MKTHVRYIYHCAPTFDDPFEPGFCGKGKERRISRAIGPGSFGNWQPDCDSSILLLSCDPLHRPPAPIRRGRGEKARASYSAPLPFDSHSPTSPPALSHDRRFSGSDL